MARETVASLSNKVDALADSVTTLANTVGAALQLQAGEATTIVRPAATARVPALIRVVENEGADLDKYGRFTIQKRHANGEWFNKVGLDESQAQSVVEFLIERIG